VGFKLVEVELERPLEPISLAPQQSGCGIIGRWRGRLVGFHIQPWQAGETIDGETLRRIADQHFSMGVLQAKTEALFTQSTAEDARTTLSVAICTKDRAQRLARLLQSLVDAVGEPGFSTVEVIVVDNASVDQSTREVVSGFAGARYVFEPRTGLNFARNAALEAAGGQLIAYLDDDVVVDRFWLAGLAEAWRSKPDAGGFTGLVLPYRLDTEAQLQFERGGGFGRGFRRLEYRGARMGNPLFPVGAGSIGAGCNMAFDRQLLIDLGGFDEALDTGAPLPGGGDLDIFYRVLRSGRAMVYEPQYAVYHEHRETIPQLRRQYWSWGLGMMAFLMKSHRTDPDLRRRHVAMVRWWAGDRMRALTKALIGGNGRDARFVLAEIWGGVAGLFGEYDRSVARTTAIRQMAQ
jgi:glycosyltransferase involved in cell wall biosynthesis